MVAAAVFYPTLDCCSIMLCSNNSRCNHGMSHSVLSFCALAPTREWFGLVTAHTWHVLQALSQICVGMFDALVVCALWVSAGGQHQGYLLHAIQSADAPLLFATCTCPPLKMGGVLCALLEILGRSEACAVGPPESGPSGSSGQLAPTVVSPNYITASATGLGFTGSCASAVTADCSACWCPL